MRLVFVGSLIVSVMLLFWPCFCLQQQEDEQMLVPHSDLPENNNNDNNNHQPMEGN